MKINEYKFDCLAILISGNGSNVGHVNLYNGKFNAYQRTYVLSGFSNLINHKYLYYFLKKEIRNYIKNNTKKGSIPFITLKTLEDFEIPVPSIKIQNQIVKILDKFSALINDINNGLPKEIELRKKQYEYYRNKLLTFE